MDKEEGVKDVTEKSEAEKSVAFSSSPEISN